MLSNSDEDLIKLMRQTAEKLCDDAICKWWNRLYSGDKDEIRVNINLWKQKKDRIGELCEILVNSFRENI